MILGGTRPLSLTSASFLTDTFDEILGGETWLWKHAERTNFCSQGSCDCLKESHVRTPKIPKSAFCVGTFISKHLNETTDPFGPPKIHQELRTKTISRISSGVDVVKVGFYLLGFQPTFGAKSLCIFWKTLSNPQIHCKLFV